MTNVLIRSRRDTGINKCRKRPCEDTGRRRLSASQWERLQAKPNLPILWSWASSLHNYEEINFCFFFSHQVSGTLLQQLSYTLIQHYKWQFQKHFGCYIMTGLMRDKALLPSQWCISEAWCNCCFSSTSTSYLIWTWWNIISSELASISPERDTEH